MLIGSVASALSGASVIPTIAAVATSTVLLPPASACVIASTSALRRARRSPTLVPSMDSATADIRILQKLVRAESNLRSCASGDKPLRRMEINCPERRSEVQCAGVANHHRAYFRRAAGAELAECRFHLIDHEIDHVARPGGTECAQSPQERLARKSHIGAERNRAHHVE